MNHKQGVYSSLEAEYACVFSVMKDSSLGRTEFEVVLVATAIGVAYCIAPDDTDYPPSHAPWSRFRGPVAIEQPFDSHFVPVRFVPGRDYQACDEQEAEYHEVVVGEAAAMCPVAVVRFREA
eukprot:TRINITY_DN3434_c0_g1_i2.p2 TRINITY_DN3434_c0_g1~~TRINITY_DN3434_c0_g1_i2.p2  ORF type:complete len:122 (+),score=21.65 TRINITY_DN3434_c0_g1_i2:78-443(+)